MQATSEFLKVVRVTVNNHTPSPKIDTRATYKLFHGTTELGMITNLYGDQPWVGGDYAPSDAANSYRDFFEHFTDEDRDLPDIGGQYPDTFFDDTLWMIVDVDGKCIPIWLPAVHWSDGDISWRWR